MWPYVLTTIAVAVFPLALAGYGGHLATIALADPKKRRIAKIVTWSLAICGIALFIASQVAAAHSDKIKDAENEAFKSKVLEGLTAIIKEPDRAKQRAQAVSLADSIKSQSSTHQAPPSSLAGIPPSDIPINPEVATRLPDTVGYGTEGIPYPEDFYNYVPFSWRVKTGEPATLQRSMGESYYFKNRSHPPAPLNISYLQGDSGSYSLALLLERAYGGAGWEVNITPRTDIAHINGIAIFQDSIENRYGGVKELREFASRNDIPLLFEENPRHITPGTFEIWIGRSTKAKI